MRLLILLILGLVFQNSVFGWCSKGVLISGRSDIFYQYYIAESVLTTPCDVFSTEQTLSDSPNILISDFDGSAVNYKLVKTTLVDGIYSSNIIEDYRTNLVLGGLPTVHRSAGANLGEIVYDSVKKITIQNSNLQHVQIGKSGNFSKKIDFTSYYYTSTHPESIAIDNVTAMSNFWLYADTVKIDSNIANIDEYNITDGLIYGCEVELGNFRNVGVGMERTDFKCDPELFDHTKVTVDGFFDGGKYISGFDVVHVSNFDTLIEGLDEAEKLSELDNHSKRVRYAHFNCSGKFLENNPSYLYNLSEGSISDCSNLIIGGKFGSTALSVSPEIPSSKLVIEQNTSFSYVTNINDYNTVQFDKFDESTTQSILNITAGETTINLLPDELQSCIDWQLVNSTIQPIDNPIISTESIMFSANGDEMQLVSYSFGYENPNDIRVTGKVVFKENTSILNRNISPLAIEDFNIDGQNSGTLYNNNTSKFRMQFSVNLPYANDKIVTFKSDNPTIIPDAQECVFVAGNFVVDCEFDYNPETNINVNFGVDEGLGCYNQTQQITLNVLASQSPFSISVKQAGQVLPDGSTELFLNNNDIGPIFEITCEDICPNSSLVPTILVGSEYITLGSVPNLNGMIYGETREFTLSINQANIDLDNINLASLNLQIIDNQNSAAYTDIDYKLNIENQISGCEWTSANGSNFANLKAGETFVFKYVCTGTGQQDRKVNGKLSIVGSNSIDPSYYDISIPVNEYSYVDRISLTLKENIPASEDGKVVSLRFYNEDPNYTFNETFSVTFVDFEKYQIAFDSNNWNYTKSVNNEGTINIDPPILAEGMRFTLATEVDESIGANFHILLEHPISGDYQSGGFDLPIGRSKIKYLVWVENTSVDVQGTAELMATISGNEEGDTDQATVNVQLTNNTTDEIVKKQVDIPNKSADKVNSGGMCLANIKGSPIYLANGEYFRLDTDISLSGRQRELSFSRYYRHLSPVSGPMGARWHSSHHIRLYRFSLPTEHLNILWDDGGQVTLNFIETNSDISKFKSEDGLYTAEFDEVDSTVTVNHQTGLTYLFSNLSQISDNLFWLKRSGNSSDYDLFYQYEDVANLGSILKGVYEVPKGENPEDSSNNPSLNFTYYDNGLLKRVAVGHGAKHQTHEYLYDQGRLNKVSFLPDSENYTTYEYQYLNRKYPYSITNVKRSGFEISKTKYNDDNVVISFDEDQERGTYDPTTKLEEKSVGADTVKVEASFEDKFNLTEKSTVLNLDQATKITSKYVWEEDKLSQTTSPDNLQTDLTYLANSKYIDSVVYKHKDADVKEGIQTKFCYVDLANGQRLASRQVTLKLREKADTLDPDVYETSIQIFDYFDSGKVRKQYVGRHEVLDKSTDPFLNCSQSVLDLKNFILQEYVYNNNDGTGNLLHQKKFTSDSGGNGIPESLEKVSFEYDDSDRVEFIIKQGKNYVDARKSGPPIENRSQLQYETDGTLKSITNSLGIVSYFEYDGGNRLVSKSTYHKDAEEDKYQLSYNYNSTGRLAKIISPTGDTTFEYDGFGKLVSWRSSKGQYQSLVYDNNGRLNKKVGINGNESTYNYDHLNQLVSKMEAGYNTYYKYTPGGYLDTITQEILGNKDKQTKLKYDYASNVIGMDVSLRNILEGETQKETLDTRSESYEVSAGGRLLTSIGFDGSKQKYEYDEQGKLEKNIDVSRLINVSLANVVDYEYDAQRRAKFITNNQRKNEFIVDETDGSITTINPDHESSKSYYDVRGNLILSITGNGDEYSYFYDYLSRLTRQEYPDGAYIKYDYENHLLKTISKFQRVDGSEDSELNHIEYKYDTKLNVTDKIFNHGQEHLVYEYDTSGNITKVESKASNIATHYQYNQSGQLTQEIYPFIHRRVSYFYDGFGNRSQVIVYDTKITGSETSYSIDYDYDQFNRLTLVGNLEFGKVTIDYPNSPDNEFSLDLSTSSELRLAQNLTYTNYEGSEVKFYKKIYFDRKNRLRKISYLNDTNSEIYNYVYQYDQNNQIISKEVYRSVNDPNDGLVNGEYYNHTVAGKLTDVTDNDNKTKAYLYNSQRFQDKNKNIQSINDSDDAKDRSFVYDDEFKDQLTATQYLDRNDLLTISNELGQLTRSDVITIDQETKQLVKLVRTFEYDALSRLVKVKVDQFSYQDNTSLILTVEEDYGYYPGSDLRYSVKKVVTRANTPNQPEESQNYYVYDGVNEFEKLDKDFKSLKVIVGSNHAYDQRFGDVIPNESSYDSYYYVSDHLNSVNYRIKSDYTEVNKQFFAPYGEVKVSSGSLYEEFGYTGRPFDHYTQLTYLRGRYLDSCSARFINEDPMQHGNNWYSYVGGNPIMRIDPTGYEDFRINMGDYFGTNVERTEPLFTPEEIGREIVSSLYPPADIAMSLEELYKAKTLGQKVGGTLNVLFCGVPFLPRNAQDRIGEITAESFDYLLKKNYRGGKHGFTKGPVGDGLDSHHIPSDQASNLTRNQGPAIQMDPADHKRTASHGSSKEAKKYRNKQKKLIDNNKFDEAFLMDVDDIQKKFGSKYDDAILEAIDALP